jgi:hypothetical protein
MARRYYEDRYGRKRRIRHPAQGMIPARVYDAGVERSQDLADQVLAEIQRNIPVITHELQKGYRVIDYPQGAAIYNKVRYWMFVEFGTRKDPEQPTVRNAIETVRTRERGGRGPLR